MTGYFVLFILLVASLQTSFAQVSKNNYSHLQDKHKEVLKRWLSKNTSFRLAEDNDASKDDLDAWRRDDKNFQPYYAVGDFNQDGKEDFAVLLKDKGKNDAAILVFNSTVNSLKSAFFKKGYGEIETLYIKFDAEVRMLYLTAYETHGFYLKPKGKTYIEFDPLD